jgi:hypothetical protein
LTGALYRLLGPADLGSCIVRSGGRDARKHRADVRRMRLGQLAAAQQHNRQLQKLAQDYETAYGRRAPEHCVES